MTEEIKAIQYMDSRGWTYFVRGGLGENQFKAFYRKPQKSPGEGEHAYRHTPWRETFHQAQADLDAIALAKGWTTKPKYEIKIRPWKLGDRGYACMPLKSNVPDPKGKGKNDDWKLVNCPTCGAKCWESDLTRQVKAIGIGALCTECAIRAGTWIS